jgi:exodeoxyribonuclease VII small subunit
MVRAKKKISVSSAFGELEELTQQLEDGEIGLEEAAKLYKKGLELAAFLKKRLARIRNEIKEVKKTESN